MISPFPIGINLLFRKPLRPARHECIRAYIFSLRPDNGARKGDFSRNNRKRSYCYYNYSHKQENKIPHQGWTIFLLCHIQNL